MIYMSPKPTENREKFRVRPGDKIRFTAPDTGEHESIEALVEAVDWPWIKLSKNGNLAWCNANKMYTIRIEYPASKKEGEDAK
jgi:hypothetical protein